MSGLVQGIYRLCDSLQPVTLAILILMLIVTGLTTIIGGADSHSRFKEAIKWIIIGAAIAFGGTLLGKEIASWFM